MRSSVVFLVSVLALAPFAMPARASTIKTLSFGERVEAAELIVRGRVVDLETVYSGHRIARSDAEKDSVSPLRESDMPGGASALASEALEAPVGLGVEGGQMLFTRVTVVVEEEVYGVAGQQIVFDIAGGRDGGRAVIVDGMPEFELGGRYLLFLRAGFEATADPVVGVYQGFFQIASGQNGEEILLDAQGDFVLGIENDEVRVRHNQASETRPSPTFIAGPVRDGAPGAEPATTSAEAARYWMSTETPMTARAFTDAVRAAKAVAQ